MENPVASAQVAERTDQLLLASQWQKGHSLLDVALSEVFTLQATSKLAQGNFDMLHSFRHSVGRTLTCSVTEKPELCVH